MGFVLSVLYFVTSYLTPATLFGPLAASHIELILAVLVFLVSLPALMRSFILKTPQSLALIGLAIAVFLSVLIGEHWAGGAVQAFLGFIPNAFAYFLVCLHCNSKRKLQVVVLMLLFVCLFVIAHGYIDLLHGVPESGPPSTQRTAESSDAESVEHGAPLSSCNEQRAGEWFYRLRGLGEINDPNDFGQLIVCVIPLMFIFWRPKKMFRNVCVRDPAGVCIAFRGVSHALARRLAGLDGDGGCGGAAAHRDAARAAAGGRAVRCGMALHFTGGREISAESGSDRTDLWGDGLANAEVSSVVRSGLRQFAGFTDGHQPRTTRWSSARQSWACSDCTSGLCSCFPR